MGLPLRKQRYSTFDCVPFERVPANKMPEFERSLLKKYRFYLECGKSQKTADDYLAVILRWLSVTDNLLHPCKESIFVWLRNRREMSAATLNREFSALRSFYRWAHESDFCPIDFVSVWPKSTRNKAKNIVRFFDEYQVGQLLAAPDLATPMGFRDHVIIRLLYETGLRASELASLSMGAVFDDGRVYVYQGKGGIDRYVPCSQEMVKLVQQWIFVRRSFKPGKKLDLFVTIKGKQFRGGKTVWDIVNRYARKALGCGAGFEKIQFTANNKPWTGFYPHMLRASMATHMLANGCDLRAIQMMLGHKNIKTTTLYLGVDMAMMRKAIKLHPRYHSV